MLGGTISSSNFSICCAIRNGTADTRLEHTEPLLLVSRAAERMGEAQGKYKKQGP